MTLKPKTKYIHEGRYVAEVDVELIEDETSWSPCLSVADANRLDQVRSAIRNGNLKEATAEARVYTLEPVATA